MTSKSQSTRSLKSRTYSTDSELDLDVDNTTEFSSPLPNGYRQASPDIPPPSGSVPSNIMELMNQLYDVFNEIKLDGHLTEIDLPQIVVCGSQSSGKTSVLESLSKEELLPKGDNIQTRCPIQLQLIRSCNSQKYVEFLHLPGQRYTDMNEVKEVIQRQNQVIKDSQKVISEDPITLKLISPEVVDLTLIDLPGIVAEPNDDEPEDLGQRIESVVLKYLEPKNSIILVVAAATSDLETNTSLTLAKKVDPMRQRTMVVLTKLDLAQGNNAYEALKGKRRKYELGIIGVVNRSVHQTGGKGGTVPTQQEALQREKEILRKNFPLVAPRNGIPYLTNRISSLLLKRITQTLPNVKGLVEEQINHLKEHLASLGTEEAPIKKRERFIEYLTSFHDAYCGQIDEKKRNLNTDTYPASAFINQAFQEKFYPEFDKLEVGKGITDREIDIAIFSSQALHGIPQFFDVTDAFQELVKREIQKVKPLVRECSKHVNKQMENAIATSHNPEASKRYHNLSNRIASVTTDLIIKCFDECKKYLEDYIDAESSIAKSADPGFVEKMVNAGAADPKAGSSSSSSSTSGSKATEPPPSQPPQSTAGNENEISEENHLEVKLDNAEKKRADIRRQINVYFEMAKIGIKNHVPRAITHKLVYGVADQLKIVLMNQLDTTEKWQMLMQESEVLLSERQDTQKSLESYEYAKEIIDRAMACPQV